MKPRPIMRSLSGLAAFAALTGLAPAQNATAPNEGAQLRSESIPGVYTFSWWGRTGITYFIQHSADLLTWDYLPVIESGTNEVIEYRFSPQLPAVSKFFLRLKSSDLPVGDPFTADFDGDGVSNYQELLNHTDPMQAVDTDFDGLPDNWEREYYHDAGLNDLRYGPNDDPDGDGATNLEEYRLGLDPTEPFDVLQDRDADGLTDLEELRLGTLVDSNDTDGDGMSDGWEVEHQLNPLIDDTNADPDGDDVLNGEEFAFGLDPQNPVSGDEGITDHEVKFGRPPDLAGLAAAPAQNLRLEFDLDWHRILSWNLNPAWTGNIVIEQQQGDGSWAELVTLPPGADFFDLDNP